MTCCPVNIVPFFNQITTTIPYTGNPVVQVMYFIDGQWKIEGVFTEIRFTGGNIVVNHGGMSTGKVIVK